MKIQFRKEKYVLENSHPFVSAILELARNASLHVETEQTAPERNDIKRLWTELGQGHLVSCATQSPIAL